MVGRIRSGAVALLLAGCYDLKRIEPGPESPYLLVDDFEDHDVRPTAPGFERWEAAPFNADNNPDLVRDLGFVEGFESAYALAGEFAFAYPGNEEFTGVNLGVFAPRELLDVRGFRAIHLAARFDSGEEALSPTTRYYVQLGCDSAPPLPGKPGPFWVQQAVELTAAWRTWRFELVRFSEPTDVPPRIAGGPAACLARVNRIRFTVATHVQQGDTASVRLYLDDVHFE